MNKDARPVLTEARDILRGDSPSAFSQIGNPGVAAAIWTRRFSDNLAGWIDGLAEGLLPDLRVLIDAPSVERCIHAACDLSGLPPGTMRDILASDIGTLAMIFAQLAGTRLLHLRFGAVRGDSCRRFHIDHVPARLLCTYRGPATQFTLADRPDAVPCHQMRTGEAAILRGALWPGHEATALLHRSPPIAGTGQVRLVLVIDPALAEQPQGRLH